MNKGNQKITPCIWFEDKCEEAVNFYVDVFNGNAGTCEQSLVLLFLEVASLQFFVDRSRDLLELDLNDEERLIGDHEDGVVRDETLGQNTSNIDCKPSEKDPVEIVFLEELSDDTTVEDQVVAVDAVTGKVLEEAS